jgi:hypothetical protein
VRSWRVWKRTKTNFYFEKNDAVGKEILTGRDNDAEPGMTDETIRDERPGTIADDWREKQ